jgi:phage shock protein A
MKATRSGAIKSKGGKTMGIMTRMLRLCKADIHGVMDQIEDKELLLKQYLREMESSLQHKASRLNQINQTMRKIERDLDLHEEEIEKLEKDLSLALRKEKDDIAKLLIRKQQVQAAGREQLQRQQQLLHEEKEQLGKLIDEQKGHYEQLKIKAATFFRQAEQRRFEETQTVLGESVVSYATDDQEIELELMRRKEQIRQGGEA